MKEEGFRIVIQKAPFPVTFEKEKYSKYKVVNGKLFSIDLGK